VLELDPWACQRRLAQQSAEKIGWRQDMMVVGASTRNSFGRDVWGPVFGIDGRCCEASA